MRPTDFNRASGNYETRCGACGCLMLWSRTFVASKRTPFNYFDCGRHVKVSPTPAGEARQLFSTMVGF